jgi:FkbM family methyltransferase
VLRGIAFRLGALRRRLLPDPCEPDVVATVNRYVRPGNTCLDVGAHIGIITRALAAAAGGDGRVVAFEAYPENAEALRSTLADEGLGWVAVENVAVTDGAEAAVWLHPGRSRLGAEWNVLGYDLDGVETLAEVEVPAASLDDFLPAGAPVDFVKIDVEGAEGRVLAGMHRLLREAKPIVLIEFHDDESWDGRHFLLEAGYQLETLAGKLIDPTADRFYHCLARPPAE